MCLFCFFATRPLLRSAVSCHPFCQHAGEQRQWATPAAFRTLHTRGKTATMSASALTPLPLPSLVVVILSFHLGSLRTKSNVIKTPLWDKRAAERREGSCEHGSHLQPLGWMRDQWVLYSSLCEVKIDNPSQVGRKGRGIQIGWEEIAASVLCRIISVWIPKASKGARHLALISDSIYMGSLLTPHPSPCPIT